MKMTLHIHPTPHKLNVRKVSRFLGTSERDSSCHGDICPGNICIDDICPYQEQAGAELGQAQLKLELELSFT